MKDKNKKQIKEHGFQANELSDIKANLKKKYEERIESHESARELMQDLANAGSILNDKSKTTP